MGFVRLYSIPTLLLNIFLYVLLCHEKNINITPREEYFSKCCAVHKLIFAMLTTLFLLKILLFVVLNIDKNCKF